MQNVENADCTMSLQSAIMNSCEDIVTVKDANLRYVSCNKAFLDLFGFNTEEQVINKKTSDVLNEQNCRIIENNFKMMCRTIEPNCFVLSFERNNYSKIMQIKSYPIIQNGEIVGVLSISRDITNEENLKLRLIEKICIINSLLENMPMLVFTKDLDGTFLSGSKYSKQFVQKGIDFYAGDLYIEMNDVEKIVNYVENFVIENKKSFSGEIKTKSINGQEHWYKVHKAPILDVNDSVTGIVSIVQNIDVEKQLELQKELFLATLTHDLKTPLQAQISSLELISKGTVGNINPSQKEIVDMIIESASFMREMLYSILSTYKYENGMVHLNKQDFNVDSLIKICMKETFHLAKEKHIEIDYKNLAIDSIINADESQIRRVFANILNNAINYAYRNTKIFVYFQEYKNSFKIKIKNTSAVIPENIKRQIFDKYVSGADLSQRRGIGLGLYFCKKVIEAHNGTISLNGIDNSNEFIIELPKFDKNAVSKSLIFI